MRRDLSRKGSIMPPTDRQHEASAPQGAIRRFDVFAEYTRQERLAKGELEDAAKGYGIWLAKVAAARRFGTSAPDRERPRGERGDRGEEPKFRSVGDELQTDQTFDHDIVERMGAAFYDRVFVPAISEARANSQTYESIRDSIRREWKPARGRTR
jgi:hypothetical protein